MNGRWRPSAGRWGLQAKMTTGYVAVTAGAALITELVIFGAAFLSSPAPLSAKDLEARAQSSAAELALKLGPDVAATGQLPTTMLGLPSTPVTPGQAQPDDSGGVAIPQTGAPLCDVAPASFAVAVSTSGTVLASSYSACYPLGTEGDTTVDGGVARKLLRSFAHPPGGSGVYSLPKGKVVWAATPILLNPAIKGTTASGRGSGAGGSGAGGSGAGGSGAGGSGPGASGPGKVLGTIYLEVPAVARDTRVFTVSPGLVRTGLVVLAVAVPAGLAFGLLSTRRLTWRLRRLTVLTLEVAEGGFDRRISVSGYDEVSQLEENFNRMAGQLQASLDARRQLAEAHARHQERSRIARELHDSISQELFSLSVLAGGLRRALPPGSPVMSEVETMERTAGDTMREMQSLLLALRPVALDEVGLASAIEGICNAYRERLGVGVQAELESLALPPALEHAILRVTQEAVANAVRHADASLITIRLRDHVGQDEILLEVADNGRGFDADRREAAGGGLGLRAMQDRIAEQGGRLHIDSAPGVGTLVRATLPLERGDPPPATPLPFERGEGPPATPLPGRAG